MPDSSAPTDQTSSQLGGTSGEARGIRTPGAGQVAGLGAVLAGIVAAVVFALSAAKALDLLGIPDPGALTTYGVPFLYAAAQVGMVCAIGGALFATFLTPPEPDGRIGADGYRATRLAAAGATITAGAALLLIVGSISNTSGVPVGEVLGWSTLREGVGQIAEARTWLITAVVAVVAATILRAAMTWSVTLIGLLVAAGTVLPLVLNGHSSAGGGHDLATNSFLWHVFAAAVWAGGLLAVLLHGFAGGKHLGLAVRRYSKLALGCFIAVAISGVLNAYIRMGLGDVLTTGYGRIVLAKTIALVVLGVLGALQRTRVVDRIESGDSAPRRLLLRLAGIELAIFTFTYGLAAGLARTPPPPPRDADISISEVELGYDLPDPPSVGRMFTEWRIDLIFGVGAILLAAAYLYGVFKLRRRGDAWPIGRTAAFVIGCLVLLVATSSGVGKYSPAQFSMHMINHMTLSMLVPVLLVLGGPVSLILRATVPAGRDNPPGLREWVLALIHSRLARFMGNPIVNTIIFIGSFYVLYLGGLFDIAVKYHAAHLLMNLHFLLSGYLFYVTVIGVDPAPVRLPPFTRFAMVVGSLPFHAFFAVALLETQSVIAADWYENIGIGWNNDLMADQQVGASIAWAAGEIPLVLVMLALLIQWRRSDDRQARRIDRSADRDDDADLNAYNAMLAQYAAKGDAKPPQ